MRKRTLSVMGMVAAAIVIAIGSASPAWADEDVVTAKVPFAFHVGNARLPAGDYVVKEVSTGSDVLLIQGVDGRGAFTESTPSSMSKGATEQPELVFQKVGNQYFLVRVVPVVGDNHEIMLTPLDIERALTRTASKLGD
jgi:hypothetical protein